MRFVFLWDRFNLSHFPSSGQSPLREWLVDESEEEVSSG